MLSARKELELKLDKIIEEKNKLKAMGLPGNLPEEARQKYYEILARQISLEDYLQEHDDEYIEKDRIFDRNKCPISAPYNKEWGWFEFSLEDSGDFIELCKHEDCPEYPNCWATKSLEPPTGGLTWGIDEDEEQH